MELQLFRGMFPIKIYMLDGDNENYDYYKLDFGHNQECTYAISKEIEEEDRELIHKKYYEKAVENLRVIN